MVGPQSGPKKRGHTLMTIILSNLNRFIYFFTERFLGKFAIKCILKILPNLAYVATLRCKILMSAKQAINDKFQGSVAAYFRCGGDINNKIKKGLLLSLYVNFFVLNRWIFGKVASKNVQKRLVHFLCLLAVCWPAAQSAWDNHSTLLQKKTNSNCHTAALAVYSGPS